MTGAELREAIKRHGITQAAFAHAIGVDPRTVRGWIGGRAVPVLCERMLTAMEYLSLEELGATERAVK